MMERKFLIELFTETTRPEAYPLRYKKDELDLVVPERALAVISERKLDQLITDGDIYQHFRIIRNTPITDDEVRRMVYEGEIDPAKQIDQWAKPENRDKISSYERAQTRSIDEKKRDLLIQAGFDQRELDEATVEEGEATTEISDVRILSHEIAARDKQIKQQKTTIKALRIRQGRPSPDELRDLIEENRFSSSGKANFTAIGKILGKDPETIRRWIEQDGLLDFAKAP